MDLKQVIGELREELESVNQVTAALEKLAELRSRRSSILTLPAEEAPTRLRRAKKGSAARASAASASRD